MRDRYLTVRSGTASGLLECLERALQYMGIADWEQKMIGLGFDWCSGGKRALRFTSAEAASVGSSFLVLSSQELSLKDALKKTFFDELLLQVYYVYEKSPKKCRELQDTEKPFSVQSMSSSFRFIMCMKRARRSAGSSKN